MDIGLEFMDADDQRLLQLTALVESCETYGYDDATVNYGVRMGLLSSTTAEMFGMESADQAQHHKEMAEHHQKVAEQHQKLQQMHQDIHAQTAHSAGKFEGRMEHVADSVNTDSTEIHERLAKMSPEEKKKIPAGKIGLILGAMIGAIRTVKGLFDIHNLTDPERVKATLAKHKGELDKLREEMYKAGAAEGAKGTTVLQIEEQMNVINREVKSFMAKSKAVTALRSGMTPGMKVATIAVTIALHALVIGALTKIVVGGMRKIKSMIHGGE